MSLCSPHSPCRCGYTGEGVHQCHAGRDPRDPDARCTQPGVERLIARPVGLAGVQMKLGATLGCYCAEHWEAAGFADLAEKIRADAPHSQG